jgi:hypothetical protein
MNNPENYPVNSNPSLLRNAIIEIHNNGGFALPLIGNAALAVLAAACQNSIDVQLPLGQTVPVSLFLWTVADSGEGKSPVTALFSKPIVDFEAEEAKKSEFIKQQFKPSKVAWKLKQKAIEKEIAATAKKELLTDDVQRLELLKAESQKLTDQLYLHELNKPKMPKRYKLTQADITPAKIARNLYENVPSLFLNSDEGGIMLQGHAMNNLGNINKCWDGSSLSVERVSSEDFEVKDARITFSIAVQGKLMEDYLKGRGRNARDIGFLPRGFFCFPMSTKGTRFVTNAQQSWPHLEALQARLREILDNDRIEMDAGREGRHVLVFSLGAKEHWIRFRNNVEANLIPGGYFSDVTDAASKSANNLARVAALFHFIEGKTGEISEETILQAMDVCDWYLEEFRRLFSKNMQMPTVESDALALEKSIANYFYNRPGLVSMKKSALTQYAPSQLRGGNNKYRLEAAINALLMIDRIRIYQDRKTYWVAYYANPANGQPTTFQQPIYQQPVYQSLPAVNYAV